MGDTDPEIMSLDLANATYREVTHTDPNLMVLTPDNSKTTQYAPIDPSSGEVIIANNQEIKTSDVLSYIGPDKTTRTFTIDTPIVIGGNGEVQPVIKRLGTITKDVYSDVSGNVFIITIIGTVLAGIVLFYLLRGK